MHTDHWVATAHYDLCASQRALVDSLPPWVCWVIVVLYAAMRIYEGVLYIYETFFYHILGVVVLLLYGKYHASHYKEKYPWVFSGL
jgi:hypothetical protein|eukprot:COSAG06_NODE_2180_length_7403_cov_177.368154_2_plen_86_part_00